MLQTSTKSLLKPIKAGLSGCREYVMCDVRFIPWEQYTCIHDIHVMPGWTADRQTEQQADGQTDRQTDKLVQTNRYRQRYRQLLLQHCAVRSDRLVKTY